MSTTRKQITAYVEPEVYALLETAAAADGRTVSMYISRMLSAALALPVPQSAVPNGTTKASRRQARAITQALKLDAAARREAAGVPQSAVPKRTAKPAASSPEEERRGARATERDSRRRQCC